MTAVIVRPALLDIPGRFGPDDVAEVLAMYDRCSPETTYRRWHGHLRAFPAAYLGALVADSDEHIAVVARREGRVVGLASAAEVTPGVREIGILVEDRWQRRGVGRELLGDILARSMQLGTRAVRADVLADDAGIIQLLRPYGPVSVRRSHGVVSGQVRLQA
jgi:GNAT superfamily N-acetyltransferase